MIDSFCVILNTDYGFVMLYVSEHPHNRWISNQFLVEGHSWQCLPFLIKISPTARWQLSSRASLPFLYRN
jgi:hypothetical protein